MLQNDFLSNSLKKMRLMSRIVGELLLSVCYKILEAIKRNEQALMNQQAMGGIPHDVMPAITILCRK
jgi:hypothetical protein